MSQPFSPWLLQKPKWNSLLQKDYNKVQLQKERYYNRITQRERKWLACRTGFLFSLQSHPVPPRQSPYSTSIPIWFRNVPKKILISMRSDCVQILFHHFRRLDYNLVVSKTSTLTSLWWEKISVGANFFILLAFNFYRVFFSFHNFFAHYSSIF